MCGGRGVRRAAGHVHDHDARGDRGPRRRRRHAVSRSSRSCGSGSSSRWRRPAPRGCGSRSPPASGPATWSSSIAAASRSWSSGRRGRCRCRWCRRARRPPRPRAEARGSRPGRSSPTTSSPRGARRRGRCRWSSSWWSPRRAPAGSRSQLGYIDGPADLGRRVHDDDRRRRATTRCCAARSRSATPPASRSATRGSGSSTPSSGVARARLAERLVAALVRRHEDRLDGPAAAPRDLGRLDVLGDGETRVELVARVGAAPDALGARLRSDRHEARSPGALARARSGDSASARRRRRASTESFEVARDPAATAGLPGGAGAPARAPRRRLARACSARRACSRRRRASPSVDTIAVGTAEGVTGQRERRELTIDDDGKRLVEEFVITIDNTRPHPVEVVRPRAPVPRPELDARLPLGAGEAGGEGGPAADRAADHAFLRRSRRRRCYTSWCTPGAVIAQRPRADDPLRQARRRRRPRRSSSHAGEIALLLGPNGAGKSTTLSAMAGAIVPSAGTIEVAGEDLATAPRSARAQGRVRRSAAGALRVLHRRRARRVRRRGARRRRGGRRGGARGARAVEDRAAAVPRAVVRHAPARRPRGGARRAGRARAARRDAQRPRSARLAVRARHAARAPPSAAPRS